MKLEKITEGFVNALTILVISISLSSCSMLPFHKSENGVSAKLFNLEAKTPPPLVLHQSATTKLSKQKEPSDIWERLRTGMSLRPLDSDRVQYYLNFYARHPHIAKTIFETSRPYLRYMTDKLEQRDMPLEIAFLPAVESGFNPRAVSSSNAKGLWQFIPGTGRYYRLSQNKNYDGRMDVIASTDAALDYLGDLYTELDGNWILALAAYNSGLSSVKRAIRKNSSRGLPTDFESLKLRKETTDYVPKLVAFSELVKHPEKYGVDLPAIDDKEVVKPIKLDRPVSMHHLAKSAGIDEHVLAGLNPGFLSSFTPSGDHYYLLTPVDAEQKILVAMNSTSPSAPSTMVARYETGSAIHKIKSGDYLSSLAKKYGTTVRAIQTANHLKGDLIIAGHDLIIPSTRNRKATIMLASTPKKFTQAGSVVEKGLLIVRDNPLTYRVKEGDYLLRLANKFGTTVHAIQNANDLKGSLIIAGHDLIIPATNVKPSTSMVAKAPVVTLPNENRSPLSNPPDKMMKNERHHIIASNKDFNRQKSDNIKSIFVKSLDYHAVTYKATGNSNVQLDPSLTDTHLAHRSSKPSLNRVLYRVGPGDTLWAISKFYRVAIAQIRQWNDLPPNVDLTKGQTLQLYPPI